MKTEENRNNAVVLLSGGMDSATCLAIARAEGLDCYTLAIDYGQRHRSELAMAEKQARIQGACQHLELQVPFAKIGPSALTGAGPVPKEKTAGQIPPTYVPARNAVFLSLGLAWAETLEASLLFIGVNQVDFSGYPDCRRDFIRAFERMANIATRHGIEGGAIRIRVPLMDLDKAAIIRRGIGLGVDYEHTHTCYDPPRNAVACGLCPACRLRLKGFAAAGARDPVEYALPDGKRPDITG